MTTLAPAPNPAAPPAPPAPAARPAALPHVPADVVKARQDAGHDRPDEVWEGTYVIMPDPNREHQRIAARLCAIFDRVIDYEAGDEVHPGLNVTDVEPPGNWLKNYRCPDVTVYLSGNPAYEYGGATVGGPDLAVEIVSPGDRTRDKLDFYAAVGTKELLVVDRDPWSLELFRLDGDTLTSVDRGGEVTTAVVPAVWRVTADEARPLSLECGGRVWPV